jgi:hypothetical protein
MSMNLKIWSAPVAEAAANAPASHLGLGIGVVRADDVEASRRRRTSMGYLRAGRHHSFSAKKKGRLAAALLKAF